jgi:hypothetical protein
LEGIPEEGHREIFNASAIGVKVEILFKIDFPCFRRGRQICPKGLVSKKDQNNSSFKN